MSKEKATANDGINRAKMYQLVLFPMNNGATNVYFVLILSYVAIFGSTVLFFAAAAYLVTLMRLFDAISDPIIGALMDRTNTKFGKFRPFMVIGNVIMAVSVILLYISIISSSKAESLVRPEVSIRRFAAFSVVCCRSSRRVPP